MSTQPGDPRPQDAAPPRPTRDHDGDGQTGTPPPGFGAQVKELLANRYVLTLMAIVVVLIVVLGIVMVASTESSDKGPGPGGALPAFEVLASAVARVG